MKKINEGKLNTVFFAAVFAVMLVLNMLTPMASDDISHYYGMTGSHCTTIGQILSDMVIFRQSVNGRVFPHFMVYLFLLWPKTIFNIVNAAMATLLAYNLSKYFEKSFVYIMTAVFALWIFIPDFGQVFLWLTGSVNYLWGLVLFTAFIYPYYCRLTEKEYRYNTAVYSTIGLLIGAWSENGATAVIFSCGIMGIVIWIKGKKLPVELFIPFICCLGGYAFLICAPATTETRAGGNILENIWFIRVCLKDFCLYLFIAYFILLITGIVQKIDKWIVLASVILVSAGLVSILVFIFAVYLPPRSFYVIVTFLIIACLILLREINIKPLSLVVLAVTSAMFVYKFIPGVEDIISLHNQAETREEILSTSSGNVVIEPYTGKTKYAAIYAEELSEDRLNWYNDLVAKYYGVESVEKAVGN